MKINICLFLLLGVVIRVFSQEIDTLQVIPPEHPIAGDTLAADTVAKEPPPYYLGVYYTSEYKLSPHYGGFNEASSFGGGVQYERWILGFTVTKFQGVIRELIIFPNVFELDYSYAGPVIGYELIDRKWWSMDAIISYQVGDMVWRNERTQEDLFRDEFSMISAFGKVDFDRVRYVKPYLQMGYQQVRNFQLEQAVSDDFTGFVFVFGIQIGFFNQ